MFCDVHRVFLEMMKDYPQIQIIAEERLQNFIENPHSRIRAKTPDLGDLIYYLAITEKYSWNDLKYFYVEEAFRRNARFISHIALATIGNPEDLLTFWMKETKAGRVTMFNVLFLETIARPEGSTIEDIKKM